MPRGSAQTDRETPTPLRAEGSERQAWTGVRVEFDSCLLPTSIRGSACVVGARARAAVQAAVRTRCFVLPVPTRVADLRHVGVAAPRARITRSATRAPAANELARRVTLPLAVSIAGLRCHSSALFAARHADAADADAYTEGGARHAARVLSVGSTRLRGVAVALFGAGNA